MLKDSEIILRPLVDDDQIPMARLANNKKIWDNLRDYFPHPYSETDAAFFITENKDQDPPMIFAIEYNGQFCGVISLIQQSDVHKNSAELGYWLGEPSWNKGIVTKAVKTYNRLWPGPVKLYTYLRGCF
ncbi:MAG: GNAT family N-acetyltransferase [Bacteroidota bacterium]